MRYLENSKKNHLTLSIAYAIPFVELGEVRLKNRLNASSRMSLQLFLFYCFHASLCVIAQF